MNRTVTAQSELDRSGAILQDLENMTVCCPDNDTLNTCEAAACQLDHHTVDTHDDVEEAVVHNNANDNDNDDDHISITLSTFEEVIGTNYKDLDEEVRRAKQRKKYKVMSAVTVAVLALIFILIGVYVDTAKNNNDNSGATTSALAESDNSEPADPSTPWVDDEDEAAATTQTYLRAPVTNPPTPSPPAPAQVTTLECTDSQSLVIVTFTTDINGVSSK